MSAVDFTQLTPAQLDAVLGMPAMAPPAGEVSNFISPPNQNGLAVGVMIVCTAFVALCLSIRAYGPFLEQDPRSGILDLACLCSSSRTLPRCRPR